MKFLSSALLLITSVAADVTYLRSNVVSEWGQPVDRSRNLRIGRLRRILSDASGSMSMSMPEEVAIPTSMSLPDLDYAAFDMFEDGMSSMSISMSLPAIAEETDFQEFEAEMDASLSMSMAVIDEPDFDQFEADFGASLSMSMSLPVIVEEESDFEQFEADFGSSLSMPLPIIEEANFEQFEVDLDTSLSMSMPMTEEVDFEQFEAEFDASLSMSIPDTSEAEEETTFEQFEVDLGASLSMSMPVTVEEESDFEQFEVDLEASLSMSIPEEQHFEQFEIPFEYSVSMSMQALEEPGFEQFDAGLESLSMSISEEVLMSMPSIGEPSLEQYGMDLELGPLSMSIPDEEYNPFEDVPVASMSMSMPVVEESNVEQLDTVPEIDTEVDLEQFEVATDLDEEEGDDLFNNFVLPLMIDDWYKNEHVEDGEEI